MSTKAKRTLSIVSISSDGPQLDKLPSCRGGPKRPCGEASDRLRSVGYFPESKKMAELDIKERQAGDVTILDLSGSVRIGEGSIALRNAIRGLVEGGKNKILLNLGGVNYMDSSGIGEL